MTAETTAVDGEQITDIAYSYDELGQLKTVKAGSDIETKYTYNIQGWLTRKSTNTNPLKPRLASINSGLIIDRDSLIMPPGGIAESLQKNIFEQTLEYFSPKHAQPRYAGNIAETSWKRGSNAEADTYAYTYDRLGRLVDGRFISGGLLITKQYGERNISYDKNTNILSLTRYNGPMTGTLYQYTYDGNRKQTLTSGTSTHTAASYGYQYDIMGNISKIGAENLLISYNYLNLPKIITKTGTPRSSDAATYVIGVTRPTASYIYLADGTKVQAIGETGQGYEYLGSLRLSVNGSSAEVESIPFAGGRIVKTSNGYEPQYYITDHLGSTRTVVKPNATVVAEFDYMPYGTQHSVAGAPITEADYKYTGKEQQSAFGLDNLYDSQARFQYVTDGSFMSHDPLSATFSDTSPYMYCGGDPINRVDQDGKKWVDQNGNLMWKNGKWTKYATSSAMHIGIAMMATKTGASTFKRIANDASMMQLELSPDIKRKDKNTLTLGEMIPLSKNNSKFPDGHIELKEGKIIIYEGSIKAFIDENKIDDDETYKLIMSLPDNVKIDGAIGSVGVHEGEHTSSENLSLHMDNTTNHANHDLEEKPIYMQHQYLKELIENLKH